MKNFIGYMFCACLLMSTSAALSDNHLDHTVKFQNGEHYRRCVYGETGEYIIEWHQKNGARTLYTVEFEKFLNETNWSGKDDYKPVMSECGIAWEGKGLFSAVIERTSGLRLHKEEDLIDL